LRVAELLRAADVFRAVLERLAALAGLRAVERFAAGLRAPDLLLLRADCLLGCGMALLP